MLGLKQRVRRLLNNLAQNALLRAVGGNSNVKSLLHVDLVQ